MGGVALVVYLLLAPPVSGDKDASEFTLVLATLGVAHPTGYPLYTLLGHVFVRLAHALGATWSYGANAWSAIGGALALALFHALVVRLRSTRRDRTVPTIWSLVPILLFGLNPMWTIETTLAEVYSWHLVWTLGACLLFMRIVRRLETPGKTSDRDLLVHAVLWGALCGIGGAHHLTAVLVAAPLSVGLVIALVRAERWKWQFPVMVIVTSLLPLTSYGFIAWRSFHPAGVQWPMLAPSWQGVMGHILGSQYRGLLGHYAPSPVQQIYLAAYVYPYLALGLLAQLVLVFCARGPFILLELTSLLATALLGIAYAFYYGASDPSSYFLPALALGLATLGRLGSRLADSWRAPRIIQAAAAGLVTMGITVQVTLWMRAADQRKLTFIAYEQLIHRMWNEIPFERGIVSWADDMHCRLREYQILSREKTGLSVVDPYLLTDPVPRGRFKQEHGFDALQDIEGDVFEGVRRSLAATFERETIMRGVANLIIHNINRQTSLPVVEFLPESTSVRLLRKPTGSAKR